jgi:hypothetical protein
MVRKIGVLVLCLAAGVLTTGCGGGTASRALDPTSPVPAGGLRKAAGVENGGKKASPPANVDRPTEKIAP